MPGGTLEGLPDRLTALSYAKYLTLPVPREPFHGWTVGEQALPTGMRRHWVRNGVPKNRIMFCGYWREGATT